MLQTGAMTGGVGLGAEHELWLAMQAAHSRYKNASASLDALTAMSHAASACPERALLIDSAAAEQRSAFEHYIETRLQLSEAMFSRQNAPPLESRRGADEEASFSSQVSPKILLAFAAAFLFPAAFGLGYVMHERTELHRVEAARDEAAAALAEQKNEDRELARRLQTLKTAPPKPVQQAVVARAPARPKRPIVRQAPAPKPLPPGGMIARNHDEVLQLQRQGERTYREFTLTPSKAADRIGPVGLEVLSVDPQRRFLDLSISVDNRAPKKTRLTLYEPVWIDLSGAAGAIEVVANRIDGDKVQGYVSEPKYSSLGALLPRVLAGLR